MSLQVVVVVACASSAGIHAALVPEHFAEGAGPGLGFLGAAVALAAAVVALTLRPASTAVLSGAAVVLAGLIASYVLAITTGIPVLHPEPEAIDRLAVATKAIEATGFLAALVLLRPAVTPIPLRLKGVSS